MEKKSVEASVAGDRSPPSSHFASGSLPLRGLANLVVVYVIWGSTYLAIRLAVREGAGIPPFTLGALRTVVAGGFLLAWAWVRGTRIRLQPAEVATLAIAGVLMWVGGNGMVNFAEQRADSSYAALLVASVPIWMSLILALLDRRRPSGRLVLALLVGFGGVGLLTAPRLVTAGRADVLAILALLAAPLLWAVGSILQLRRPVKVSPLVSAAYLHLFGAAAFAVIALAAREPLPQPSLEAWGALGYLIVAGSVISFTSYIRALHLLPTPVAMTYAYVNPVIAVILGAVLLHEPLTAPIVGGMVLILVGVWGVFREQFGRRGRRSKGPGD